MPEIICGHGFVDAELVKANQKIPMGNDSDPNIMSRSLVSCGRPSALFGDSRERVVKEIKSPAIITPVSIDKSGRLDFVALQPLSAVNEAG